MAVKLTPQRRVLAVAASQVGYSRWSDSQRGTKYARDTQPVFWPRDFWLLANGINYCDIFVTWAFWKALGKDFVTSGALPAGASYNTDYRASKGGRVSKSEAAPGDILVYDWNWNTRSTNHVGILEKRLSGARFQAIEGNTSVSNVGSQDSGGRVARRVRKHSQVRYVIRPDWSKAGGTTESVAATKNPWNSSKTINSLSKVEVKEIQTDLKALGYSLGSYGVDGSYGESTYNAVRAFQTHAKLSVDGVAGPDTRKAMKTVQKGTSKPSKPAKKQNVEVDSRFGSDTVKVFQRYLNKFHGAELKVDGKAGHEFWKALQRAVGTPVDGKVSRQSRKASSLGNGITQGWEYTGANSKGSLMVRKVQSWAGAEVDGVWGPGTSKAVQKKLNTYDL